MKSIRSSLKAPHSPKQGGGVLSNLSRRRSTSTRRKGVRIEESRTKVHTFNISDFAKTVHISTPTPRASISAGSGCTAMTPPQQPQQIQQSLGIGSYPYSSYKRSTAAYNTPPPPPPVVNTPPSESTTTDEDEEITTTHYVLSFSLTEPVKKEEEEKKSKPRSKNKYDDDDEDEEDVDKTRTGGSGSSIPRPSYSHNSPYGNYSNRNSSSNTSVFASTPPRNNYNMNGNTLPTQNPSPITSSDTVSPTKSTPAAAAESVPEEKPEPKKLPPPEIVISHKNTIVGRFGHKSQPVMDEIPVSYTINNGQSYKTVLAYPQEMSISSSPAALSQNNRSTKQQEEQELESEATFYTFSISLDPQDEFIKEIGAEFENIDLNSSTTSLDTAGLSPQTSTSSGPTISSPLATQTSTPTGKNSAINGSSTLSPPTTSVPTTSNSTVSLSQTPSKQKVTKWKSTLTFSLPENMDIQDWSIAVSASRIILPSSDTITKSAIYEKLKVFGYLQDGIKDEPSPCGSSSSLNSSGSSTTNSDKTKGENSVKDSTNNNGDKDVNTLGANNTIQSKNGKNEDIQSPIPSPISNKVHVPKPPPSGSTFQPLSDEPSYLASNSNYVGSTDSLDERNSGGAMASSSLFYMYSFSSSSVKKSY